MAAGAAGRDAAPAAVRGVVVIALSPWSAFQVSSGRSVEAHVRRLLSKLDITDSDDAHRRVLAVLTYLRAA